MERLVVPEFATEAEEADWWDQHMDVVEANFIEAAEKGTLRRASETEHGRRRSERPETEKELPQDGLAPSEKV